MEMMREPMATQGIQRTGKIMQGEKMSSPLPPVPQPGGFMF